MKPDRLAELARLPDRQAFVLEGHRVEAHDGYCVEHLELRLKDEKMRGILTRPAAAITQHLPAVLYCHAHGKRYHIGASELLDGRPSLISPYGPVLAQAGFVSLSIDMPTFGERQEPGEDALSKALLWRGQTLMGKILGELRAAFDFLAARDDVDADRIAAFGLSMGATHAFLLGAIEPRLARIAHLCSYADWAALIETGAHDRHGHYMTIPGLLAQTSVGEIAGMIAPRPQLIGIGCKDPLTPTRAVEIALEETRAAYDGHGAANMLTTICEAECGHVETPNMREAVLRFLRDDKR